jgi:signal transduction histidine kinase
VIEGQRAQTRRAGHGPLPELARRSVLTGLLVAFAGAGTGLVLNLWLGPSGPLELTVIAACAAGSLLLAGVLLWPGLATPRQVAGAATVFFCLYLLAGAGAAIAESSSLLRLMPYLLWYFPLLAFNRFTNTGWVRRAVDIVLVASPLGIITGYLLAHHAHLMLADVAPGWAVLTSYAAYAFFLDRFSGYREAIADQHARADEAVKTAQALEEHEVSYQRIMNEAGAGIGMIDAGGTILWTNGKLAEWVGAPTVRGWPMVELISGGYRDAWRAGIARVSAGAVPRFEFEYTLSSAPRGQMTIRSIFLPAPSAGGQAGGLVFISYDVTELRQLDLQLRQSQKMEALGRLTGGIAHDFNNLLTVILGSSEALVHRLEAGSEEQELAGIIEEATERAAGLVRRLLAFSQKQELAPQPCDVRELIDNAVALFGRVLPESVRIDVIHAQGTGLTLIDPGQFESALLNLVVNARDAMPRGGTIRLSTRPLSLPGPEGFPQALRGRYVVVAVSDEGEGMSEETLARAFEPFFTTKGAGQGSGLGLSMVYGFIRQTGGDVQVLSTPGAGTEIRLLFPAMPEQTGAPV